MPSVGIFSRFFTTNLVTQPDHRPLTILPGGPRRIRGADQIPDTVAAEYENGTSMGALAAKHHTYLAAVRRRLVALGVTIRPRGSYPGMGHSASKITPEQRDWILQQDLQDVDHAEIGRQLGISRERVRQICLAAGHRTRRERMTKGLAVREAREARKAEKEKWVEFLSERWKAGASFSELAALFNLKTAGNASSKISFLRQKYGLDLFPRRSPNHSRVTDPAIYEQKITELSRLWREDVPAREIAQRLGYASVATVHTRVVTLRRSRPEMFPFRQRCSAGRARFTRARLERMSELWRSGADVRAIAAELGCSNPGSIYNAIARYRPKYPDLFPYRIK